MDPSKTGAPEVERLDVPIRSGRILGPEDSRDKVLAVLKLLELPVDAVEPAGISYERLDDADWPLAETVMELISRRFPMA